jgi:hypothetical protein
LPPETPPPMPPPMPPQMPPAGYSAPPPQGGPPPNNYQPYVPAPAPPPRSGMPTWAWVLIGCVGCFAVGGVLFVAMLFPVFGTARGAARQVSCLSNMRIVALGSMMYLQDYDERMPMAGNWQEGIMPYVKKEDDFHCPETTPNGGGSPGLTGTSYAFNSALDQVRLAQVADPRATVLHFETTNFSPNASDALTSLPHPARHKKSGVPGNNVSLVDGHAVYWPETDPLPEGQILATPSDNVTSPEAPAPPDAPSAPDTPPSQ